MKFQSNRAPDLLVIEEVLADPPAAAEGADPQPVTPGDRKGPRTYRARLGTVAISIEKVGRREGDPLDRIMITVADLRRITKENYRLGWNGHCGHVKECGEAMTREIGE